MCRMASGNDSSMPRGKLKGTSCFRNAEHPDSISSGRQHFRRRPMIIVLLHQPLPHLLLQFVLLRLLVRTYFSFCLLFSSSSYRRYLSARLTHIAPGHCFSFVIFVSRLFSLATYHTSMMRHLVDSWTDTALYPHYYTSLLPTLIPPANSPSYVL